jgi:hypothetical protein
MQPESRFEIGHQIDLVFQALIDRSRSGLDLKTIKTILGYQRGLDTDNARTGSEWDGLGIGITILRFSRRVPTRSAPAACSAASSGTRTARRTPKECLTRTRRP